MAQIEIEVAKFDTKDLYKQGRENICLGLFEDQSDESLYPSDFEKTSIVEIESFMNKLAVLEPRMAPERNDFRVLNIIQTNIDNKVILYDMQKLDKYGIRVYLNEDGEYGVYVKGEIQDRYMCTPNIRDIVSSVYNYMLGEHKIPPLKVFNKFYRSIYKTLTE